MRVPEVPVPEVPEQRAFEKHQQRTHLYKHHILGLVCLFLMGGSYCQRLLLLAGPDPAWRYKSGGINMHYRYEMSEV